MILVLNNFSAPLILDLKQGQLAKIENYYIYIPFNVKK